MNAFFDELNRQRWDDHRFYHHCRINQSLHLFSACCFVIAYLLLPFEPAWSAIIAWCLSMTSRQAGHFFFEPRGFDEVNQVTDEYKEAVKVGYNIRRKIVLMAIWVACPVALIVNPSLGGLIEPPAIAIGRIRLGYEDPHRSVSRHRALPPCAACAPARRALRPDA
jgi:hypothetical protein